MQFAQDSKIALVLLSKDYIFTNVYIKTEILEFRHFLSTLGCFLKCEASLLNFGISLHLFNFPTS